jgi:hypothetical protein
VQLPAQAANAQSKKIVAQAQAGVDLIDAQIQKYTLYAPMDGVILTRSVEPGEFLQPGAIAMSLGDLSKLTITVYVPEDRYGRIHQGQRAIVEVDSFPGLTFDAEVTSISDHADHSAQGPNRGGRSAVYAVKLSVIDAEALKPGMPADGVSASKAIRPCTTWAPSHAMMINPWSCQAFDGKPAVDGLSCIESARSIVRGPTVPARRRSDAGRRLKVDPLCAIGVQPGNENRAPFSTRYLSQRFSLHGT